MRTKLTLFATACLLLAPPAHAQWSSNPMFPVSVSNAPGDQIEPRIGRLESTGYTMIFWLNYVSPIRAYYQVLDESGNPLFEPNGVPLIDGTWFTAVVSVLPDGQGGLIVICRDTRSGNYNIYGQRFDQNGMPLWGPTGLPLAVWPGQNINIKDFDADELGNFFISWSIGSANVDQYAQKFNRDGQRLWGDYGVPVSTYGGNQSYAKAVPDEVGGLISIWADDRAQPNNSKLYTQHLNAQGHPLLTPNGEPVLYQGWQIGAPYLLEAVTDGQSGGVWTWQTSGQNNYFKLMRVSYTDSGYQVEWLNTSSLYCSHFFSGMLAHPTDGAVWLSSGDNRYGGVSSEDYISYLYRYDLNGNPTFGASGIPYGTENEGAWALVSDGVITFKFYSSSLLGVRLSNLNARRINTSGHLVWQTVAAQHLLRDLSISLHYAFYLPVATSDGADGAVVAFEDYRDLGGSQINISAQRVLSNGQLGNLQTPATPVTDKFTQPMNSNPNQGVLTYTLPQAGNIKAELYDILGRKLSTLYQGYRETGPLTIQIPQATLPSGIYLVRLNTPQKVFTSKIVITR